MTFNLNNENNKMLLHKGMMRLIGTYVMWLDEQGIVYSLSEYDGAGEPHCLSIDDEAAALAFKLRFNV